MIVEIDDDCADRIVQESLVNTYVWLSADLKTHKKNPSHLHPDDAIAYKSVVEAAKVLGNWYFAYGDFDKAVKKARKNK